MPLSQMGSMVGAFLILAAYFGLQTKRLNESSLLYLNFNFFGALLLLVAALISRQIGFVILEGAWVGVTLYSFLRRCRKK